MTKRHLTAFQGARSRYTPHVIRAVPGLFVWWKSENRLEVADFASGNCLKMAGSKKPNVAITRNRRGGLPPGRPDQATRIAAKNPSSSTSKRLGSQQQTSHMLPSSWVRPWVGGQCSRLLNDYNGDGRTPLRCTTCLVAEGSGRAPRASPPIRTPSVS